MGKTHIKTAKFQRTDLFIFSHSREAKNPSYSQINTVVTGNTKTAKVSLISNFNDYLNRLDTLPESNTFLFMPPISVRSTFKGKNLLLRSGRSRQRTDIFPFKRKNLFLRVGVNSYKGRIHSPVRKFFPLRVDPFYKGLVCKKKQTRRIKNCLKMAENRLQCIHVYAVPMMASPKISLNMYFCIC